MSIKEIIKDAYGGNVQDAPIRQLMEGGVKMCVKYYTDGDDPDLWRFISKPEDGVYTDIWEKA